MRIMKRTTLSSFVLGLLLTTRIPSECAQSIEDLVQRGIRAFKAGDFAQAQQIFSNCVQQQPSAENFNYLALSEWSSGHYDQALVHFQRSIRLGNDSARVHYNLGLAYVKQHRLAPGVRELQHAIEIDPSLKEARYALALVLLDVGRPDEAIPHLIQAREQSPCDAEIWANLARAQLEAGDVNAALRTSVSRKG